MPFLFSSSSIVLFFPIFFCIQSSEPRLETDPFELHTECKPAFVCSSDRSVHQEQENDFILRIIDQDNRQSTLRPAICHKKRKRTPSSPAMSPLLFRNHMVPRLGSPFMYKTWALEPHVVKLMLQLLAG